MKQQAPGRAPLSTGTRERGPSPSLDWDPSRLASGAGPFLVVGQSCVLYGASQRLWVSPLDSNTAPQPLHL